MNCRSLCPGQLSTSVTRSLGSCFSWSNRKRQNLHSEGLPRAAPKVVVVSNPMETPSSPICSDYNFYRSSRVKTQFLSIQKAIMHFSATPKAPSGRRSQPDNLICFKYKRPRAKKTQFPTLAFISSCTPEKSIPHR